MIPQTHERVCWAAFRFYAAFGAAATLGALAGVIGGWTGFFIILSSMAVLPVPAVYFAIGARRRGRGGQ